MQKKEGVSAIIEAVIYIVTFIIYGGVLESPGSNASAVEKLNFLSNNYLLLSIVNFISYILFGILLVMLILAIHQRFKIYASNLSKLTFVFGVIWAMLVIASGMITNTGLNYIVETDISQAEITMDLWSSVSIISEAIGGANEIIGGIWVLLISIMALQQKMFSKALNALGILIGISGILTSFPLNLFKEIFGLGQIIWFLWIGIIMIRKPQIATN